jgi:hypothetical protein
MIFNKKRYTCVPAKGYKDLGLKPTAILRVTPRSRMTDFITTFFDSPITWRFPDYKLDER